MPTSLWCHPYDEATNEGCAWWRDGKPPGRETCDACMVTDYFCAGCQKYADCPKYPFPKVRPHVARFLSRTNIADKMGQQIYPTDWRALPQQEYEMLARYVNVRNKLEAERLKDMKARGSNA